MSADRSWRGSEAGVTLEHGGGPWGTRDCCPLSPHFAPCPLWFSDVRPRRLTRPPALAYSPTSGRVTNGPGRPSTGRHYTKHMTATLLTTTTMTTTAPFGGGGALSVE